MRCAVRTVMEQWWKNQNTTSHDEKIFFEDHFFNGFLIPNFQDDHGHESFKNICCLKQHFLFFSTDESNFLIYKKSPFGLFFLLGRLMGFEPTSDGATIRCVNHFTTIAMCMLDYT